MESENLGVKKTSVQNVTSGTCQLQELRQVSILNFLKHINDYISIILKYYLNVQCPQFQPLLSDIYFFFYFTSFFFFSFSKTDGSSHYSLLFYILIFLCLSLYSNYSFPKNVFPIKFQQNKFYPQFVVSTTATFP